MLPLRSLLRLVCYLSLWCCACSSPNFKDADAAARGDTEAGGSSRRDAAGGSSMDGGGASGDSGHSGSEAGSSSGTGGSPDDAAMSSGTGWECNESGTFCSCTFCGGPICPPPSASANAPVCANYGCCYEFSAGGGIRGCLCSERDAEACESQAAKQNMGRVVASCPPPGEFEDDRACVSLGESCARADLTRLDARGCCEGSCILDSKGEPRCQTVSGPEQDAALACEHAARKILADEAKLVGSVNTSLGTTHLDTVSYLSVSYGENVCLSELTIDFESTLDGCELKIRAGHDLDAEGRLVIDSVTFEADACDGLSGGGYYFSSDVADINGTVSFAGVRCESANEGNYCAQGEYRIEIGGTLWDSYGEVSFPDPIVISGVICGQADVLNAPCAAP